jgi:hypothetical protein
MAIWKEAIQRAFDYELNALRVTGGNKVCLSTEPKPAGQQGETLLEYDPDTFEFKVYVFIAGNWREI